MWLQINKNYSKRKNQGYVGFCVSKSGSQMSKYLVELLNIKQGDEDIRVNVFYNEDTKQIRIVKHERGTIRINSLGLKRGSITAVFNLNDREVPHGRYVLEDPDLYENKPWDELVGTYDEKYQYKKRSK